jgi:hypothetical protein
MSGDWDRRCSVTKLVAAVVSGWGDARAARDEAAMGASAVSDRRHKRPGLRPLLSTTVVGTRLELATRSKVAKTTTESLVASVAKPPDAADCAEKTNEADVVVTSVRDAMLLVESVFEIVTSKGLVRPKCLSATMVDLVRCSARVDSHNVVSSAWALLHWHVPRCPAARSDSVRLDFDTRVRLAACLSLAFRFELEDSQTVDRVRVGDCHTVGVICWHFLSARDQRLHSGCDALDTLRKTVEREEAKLVCATPQASWKSSGGLGLLGVSTRSLRPASELHIWKTLERYDDSARLAARVALVYYTRTCALAGRFDLLAGDPLNTSAFTALSCVAVGIGIRSSVSTLARAMEVVAVRSADETAHPLGASSSLFRRIVPGLRLGALPTLKASAR